MNIADDLNKSMYLINNPYIVGRSSGKIYRNTNENLSYIFKDIDFKDKEVLSVLASSDQLFAAYYLGAKNVDTYDINKLTLYYYYLKKWCLLKYKTADIPNNNDLILEALKVECNSEEEYLSKIYWETILSNINEPLYSSGLFIKTRHKESLPYFNNLEGLAKIIKNITPNYSNINILEKIDINKQYDILILSNILEYLYDCEKLEKNKSIAAQNIYDLLKPDGIAISTNILCKRYRGGEEFSSLFDLKSGPYASNDCDYTNYYIYQKKR